LSDKNNRKYFTGPIRGGKEKILLAEDNESVRILTRDMHREYGYTVIEASDGEEALNKFNVHRDAISLIILDVIMPKKNGKEVLHKAREIQPGIKVIFTSGYPADLIQKEGIIEKGLNIIIKPYPQQVLPQKIRELLDH